MNAYLQKYCSLLGPSGMEDEVRNAIINDIKASGSEYNVDAVGNLTVFKKGKKRRKNKVLFSAHMDEVGFMVKYIDKDGYLRFDCIGGIDRRVVSGRRVVFCNSGINGVVASKSVHIQTDGERDKCEPVSEMHIDIGATDRETAMKYITVGDCAVFRPDFTRFGKDLICSKAIDDRFGCALLTEMINSDLEYDTYFAFNTCEEVGCYGASETAFKLRPDVVFAVEATTAGDISGVPSSKCACKLGSGAVLSIMDGATVYDRELLSIAVETANKNKIAWQYKNVVAGGNESGEYQKTACGARVLAVSIPARYIHSASNTVSEHDIEAVSALLNALCERSYD